jgi:hypothetical protein
MYYGSRVEKPPGFTEEQHKAGLIPQAYYRTVGETPEGYAGRINELGDKSQREDFFRKMKKKWSDQGAGVPFNKWLLDEVSSYQLMPSE